MRGPSSACCPAMPSIERCCAEPPRPSRHISLKIGRNLMVRYLRIAGVLAPSLAIATATWATATWATVAWAQALPERIEKTKTVQIAVNAVYPPMEYKDPQTGALVGFDIDLGHALAKELGLTFEWQESAFEQLIPSLQTERADMILSGLSDRPARRETMEFIDYLKSVSQFFVLA